MPYFGILYLEGKGLQHGPSGLGTFGRICSYVLDPEAGQRREIVIFFCTNKYLFNTTRALHKLIPTKLYDSVT
jgi:hypothetical protein